MAEKNLLTQHKSREDDGGYYSFAQVKQTVENYDTLNLAYTNNQSWAIQSITNGLKDLQKILESQERVFYNSLGLSGPSAILELQKRVDEWNASGANILLDKKLALQTTEIMQVEIDDAALYTSLNTLVNDYSIANQIIDEEINLSTILNDIFGRGRYKSMKKLGVDASLKVQNNQGKIVVQQTGGKPLSQGMKRKIATDLNEYSEETYVNITTKEWENIQAQIYNTIVKNIINEEVKNCIKYEFYNRNEKDYNKWSNLFVVQGWFGEVYWNACMSFLFQKKGVSLPTGAKYNILGKQLSVDMIVKSCGFQVKNWSLKEDRHTTEKTMLLGNFLSTRADLLNSFVGDIIAQMFGTISYNKPNAEYASTNESMAQTFTEYQSFYDTQVQPKATELENLTFLLKTRLNKIIEIDNGGMLKEPIEKEKEFYNTFWLINDKIIPSSIIIDNLIKEIESRASEDVVNFEVKGLEDKGEKVWPSEVNTTNLVMANRWRLSYMTEFNLNTLLQKIVQKI